MIEPSTIEFYGNILQVHSPDTEYHREIRSYINMESVVSISTKIHRNSGVETVRLYLPGDSDGWPVRVTPKDADKIVVFFNDLPR